MKLQILFLTLLMFASSIKAMKIEVSNFVSIIAICSKTRCLKITEKSLIQRCERSELRLHFEWTKLIKNAKNRQFGEFFNLKLTELGGKFNCDILSNFQTM